MSRKKIISGVFIVAFILLATYTVNLIEDRKTDYFRSYTSFQSEEVEVKINASAYHDHEYNYRGHSYFIDVNYLFNEKFCNRYYVTKLNITAYDGKKILRYDEKYIFTKNLVYQGSYYQLGSENYFKYFTINISLPHEIKNIDGFGYQNTYHIRNITAGENWTYYNFDIKLNPLFKISTRSRFP